MNADGSPVKGNFSVNATTMSVRISNLTTEAQYQVSVRALTVVGPGPASKPKPVTMDPDLARNPKIDPSDYNGGGMVQQPWFIGLIGVLIVITLTVFVVLLYFRRKQAKKKALGQLNCKYIKSFNMLLTCALRSSFFVPKEKISWHCFQFLRFLLNFTVVKK